VPAKTPSDRPRSDDEQNRLDRASMGHAFRGWVCHRQRTFFVYWHRDVCPCDH
jgi:hypothetical protein